MTGSAVVIVSGRSAERYCLLTTDYCLLLSFHDVDGLARLQVAGVEDDGLADVDAGEDFRPGVGAAARGDGLLPGLAVLDRDDLLDAGEGDDGVGRHGDGHVAAVGDDLGAREAARSEAARVRDLRLDDEHAVLLVDGRAQAHDAAGVEAAVALDRDAHGLAGAHRGRVALGHLAAEAQGVHAHDGHDRRGRAEVLAQRGVPLLHEPVEGRDDHGVRERLPRERKLGAPLREQRLAVANLLDGVLVPGLRDLEGGVGRLVLGERDDARLDERGDALPVLPRLFQDGARLPDGARHLGVEAVVVTLRLQAQPRARLLERGLGLLHAQAVVLLLDLRHHLPAPHDAAEVDGDGADAPRHLDAQRRLVLRGERARDVDARADGQLLDARDLDLPRLAAAPRAGALLLTRSRVLALAREGGREREREGRDEDAP